MRANAVAAGLLSISWVLTLSGGSLLAQTAPTEAVPAEAAPTTEMVPTTITETCDAAHAESEANPAAPAATTAAPTIINDRQVIRQIERAASELIEAGRTTEMATLIEQLNRESCNIKLPAASEAKLEPWQVYERCRPGVLVVAGIFKCDRCDNWHAAPASGFVITADGIAVTNHHVVHSPDRATLVAMTADGRVVPVREVLAASAVDDVAIIRLEGGEFTPLPLSTNAPVGSDVFVISHPDRRFFTFSKGVVARYGTIQRERTETAMLEITADYARGSSGGPVLNRQGAVVGLVSSTVSVYYNTENGRKDNLQMVFKQCVPAEKVLNLIKR